MNNSPVADALRFAVTQTVRALTQPGGIQAIATELQQQAPQTRPNALAPGAQAAVATNAESTSVELSPAALMPPVDATGQLAATRGATATPLTVAMLALPQMLSTSRPGDGEYGAVALRLAAQLKQEAEAPPTSTQPLAGLLRSVSTQSAMANYAAMQPVIQRRRDETQGNPFVLRNRQDSTGISATALLLGDETTTNAGPDHPLGPTISLNPGSTAAPASSSPTATQILRADLAYQEFAPKTDTPARVDLYRFGQREGDAETGDGAIETLGATIYLHMPELGDVVVTLALAGRDVDLAIAAPGAALTVLRNARDELAATAQAWGVRMRGISFVPFDRRGSSA